MSAALGEVVARFSSKKVLVLGDVMLDEYIWGTVSRISPEAPVPVVEVERVSYMPGGTANVAMNIASLGGKVYLSGVVGDDEAGDRIKALFSNGVNIEGLRVDAKRPTTLKTRVIAHNQQVVRVDRERREPIVEPIIQELLAYTLDTLPGVDVLLISDYAKGVTVPALLKQVIAVAKAHGKPVVVDPKGQDYTKYKGATVITPNRLEAEVAVNHKITDVASLIWVGQGLLHQTECKAVLITRGEEGMSLFEQNGGVIHLSAMAREVYDVTGAGDTVVGTLALGLATGADLVDCARVANYAAGIVVGKVGTAVVTMEELLRVLVSPVA
ncbi:D-glycero-beta-D-manno-heptose-7-phosphate kinase [Candidatus Poribacteria bacterium]|nr:D-glycero-beta-D-manno-heptose-7-phosphate kinase [Candidatus Poribacteria bacterium]